MTKCHGVKALTPVSVTLIVENFVSMVLSLLL